MTKMSLQAQSLQSSRTSRFAARRSRLDYFTSGAVIAAAFCVTYYMSLSFVYIEGDDAQTMAYHMLGRNVRLAMPYGAYQSMMDAVLSVLPAKEAIVRVTAMTLTAVSAPILVFLAMALAFEWCGDILRYPRWPLAAVMLLAVPEYFYLGMVFTPAIVAMMLLVASHLIVRHSVLHSEVTSWLGFSTSIVLFGVGAAMRWDTVSYGAPIVTDLVLRAGAGAKWQRRLGWPIVWGTLAGLTWLTAIYANGYGLSTLVKVIRIAPSDPFDWKLSLARIQTLITPVLAVLLVVGIWRLVRDKRPQLVFILLISTLPLGRLPLWGTPKIIITLTPALVAIGLCGLATLWERRGRRYAVVALALLPWLVGDECNIRASLGDQDLRFNRYDRFLRTHLGPY